ncbi:hypothetical protein BELL_0301g00060 [Botrytis elliptica]|uniref:Uncharacterized protein n=1 Tax=Botrytis elliptica TaxID=278938 RepID=A0A4Z1JKA9_9HELO|nr:hypothetical protein EAE99_000849 [Botrytis elliptica]TGO74189.1 hypothetical protein BELL_0301g00060 [Botrytis elliptica]
MLGVQTTSGDSCIKGDKQEAEDGTGTTALVAWLFLTVKPTSERSVLDWGNYRVHVMASESLNNADVGKARSAPTSSEEAETSPYHLLGDYRFVVRSRLNSGKAFINKKLAYVVFIAGA